MSLRKWEPKSEISKPLIHYFARSYFYCSPLLHVGEQSWDSEECQWCFEANALLRGFASLFQPQGASGSKGAKKQRSSPAGQKDARPILQSYLATIFHRAQIAVFMGFFLTQMNEQTDG